jgi:hypothetical protein
VKTFQHRARLIYREDSSTHPETLCQWQGKPAIPATEIGKGRAGYAEFSDDMVNAIAPLFDNGVRELSAIGKSLDVIDFSVNKFASQ